MFYIYVLYPRYSDKYYVSYTNDYSRRVVEHNTSERNTYASKHRPWMLKAALECGNSETNAMTIEKFIKNPKSRRLIEKIINNEPLTGILNQLVRVPSVRD